MSKKKNKTKNIKIEKQQKPNLPKVYTISKVEGLFELNIRRNKDD